MSELSQEDGYQKRIPIFPRSVKGRFRKLKWSVLLLAYSVYFLLPWLRWDRSAGPQQAVMFDIDGRHFYLFDLIVFAQDIFWLAGVLMIFAFLLFFVTGIAGRVFCGYFCFQTLWTDLFMFIERMVQGERPARIRLYKSNWGLEKFFKLGLTHLLWIMAAFVTGLTFTLYWGDAPDLVTQFFSGVAPFPAYATTLFLTFTTYLMAGMAREQVCTYMCPYSRFQSAMFDENTLIVAYDANRGEGENGRKKLSKVLKEHEVREAEGFGDCIDCGYCVQVCPTGIDIRDGLQYQCISCALCIDACNEIMGSVGYPKNLISYTSENSLEGKKTKFFKPGTIGYGIALLLAAGLLTWSVVHRSTLELAVNQIRQPLSVTLADGRVQNSYELKIANKTSQRMEYRIETVGLAGAELEMGNFSTVTIDAERNLRIYVRVRVEPETLHSNKTLFGFVVIPLHLEDKRVRHDASFFANENQLRD